MKERFIVIYGRKSIILKYSFADLFEQDNVDLNVGNLIFRSKAEELLYRLHNSVKINKIISLPGRNIWKTKRFNYLLNYQFESDTLYYVVVLDMAAATMDLDQLNSIKADNVKLVLAFFNPISDTKICAYPFSKRDIFDLVMTFDQEDSRKYGFKHFFQLYSKMGMSNNKVEYDAYFIGYPKGREKDLRGIAQRFKENGISWRFKIIGNGNNELFNYIKKPIPYGEVVDDISRCKCIIEIVQDGQSGATVRYNEAICYDKILITNNREIVDFPMYNPEYMHVFEKPDDIDPKWIKDNKGINYHYDNEFSPVRWLDAIRKEFC